MATTKKTPPKTATKKVAETPEAEVQQEVKGTTVTEDVSEAKEEPQLTPEQEELAALKAKLAEKEKQLADQDQMIADQDEVIAELEQIAGEERLSRKKGGYAFTVTTPPEDLQKGEKVKVTRAVCYAPVFVDHNNKRRTQEELRKDPELARVVIERNSSFIEVIEE
ncbi:MAG: hypothetical protein AAF740_01630 [Bacteroidota bacterium]